MASLVLFLAFLSIFSYSAGAATSSSDDSSHPFNITKILNKYSDYSSFNGLLSQYKVADMINRRKTITVLAVNDVSAITTHPDDAVKKILMNHVILDFYGVPKLKKLKKSIVLTTLLQTTGSARSRQGFVNITVSKDGDIVMGSAVKGSDHNSKVLEEVMKQPFDICVLGVSQPIIAPGVDSMVLLEAPSPAPGPRARSPKKSKAKSKAPAPESEDDEEPASPPSGEAPGEAADEPTADKKDADAPAPESSAAAGRVGLSVAAAVMGFMCFLAVV